MLQCLNYLCNLNVQCMKSELVDVINSLNSLTNNRIGNIYLVCAKLYNVSYYLHDLFLLFLVLQTKIKLLSLHIIISICKTVSTHPFSSVVLVKNFCELWYSYKYHKYLFAEMKFVDAMGCIHIEFNV